jgi:lipopolysaccharide transport system permease protein
MSKPSSKPADARAGAERRAPSPLPPVEAGTAGSLPLDPPETAISSSARVRLLQSLRDLWTYRDLFGAFVARDLKVRYKQTALGVIWVILQPLLTGGLLSVIFRRLGAGVDASALAFMGALVPWTSFATAVQNASTSMELNANMINKVYFPRLIVPGAYVCGSVVDFVLSFAALLVIAAVSGAFTPWLLVLMPLLLFIQLTAALGLGFFFGALNAQYHDVKYVVPFLLQIGMLATVLQPLRAWSPEVSQILALNPMAAVVETYRDLLSGYALDWPLIAQGAAIGVAFLLGGLWFFRAREARLMDIL